jgi:hypothetical protein
MTPHLQMNWFIEVMDVVTDGPAPAILIVEAYPDLRMLAVQFLKEEGFETLEAGDADQAIAISSIIRLGGPVGWNSRLVVQNCV